jgi:hypothetical protein
MLFGYDQGVVSGILTMESFGARFPRIYSDSNFEGWFVSTLLLCASLPLPAFMRKKHSFTYYMDTSNSRMVWFPMQRPYCRSTRSQGIDVDCSGRFRGWFCSTMQCYESCDVVCWYVLYYTPFNLCLV